MHFEVAVGEYLPYLKLSVLFGRVYMSGPLADAFHLLSVRLNFTYNLHRVKGNTWGMRAKDGWTGMLGMIERKEVDMAVGPFTMTYDRWSSFKLSAPLYVDNVEILVPATEWKMTLFSVVTVFSATVWLSLFMALVIMAIVFTGIDKYQHDDINLYRRFFQNFWLTLQTLMQKGRSEKPDYYIQSFLSGMWMFTALVVSSTFSGVLLTRLFVRKVQKIDSIEDLVAAQKIQPVLENHSSVFGMFQNSQAEIYQSIFQRVTSNPDKGILTFENMSTIGMDYVYSGSSALITDGMGLKGFMAKRLREGLPCNFWLAKETVFPMWKVVAFGKTFPDDWLMKINNQLRHYLETGWLQSRMQREYAKFEECLSPNGNGILKLGLEHTKGIFLIWSFGCGAALVVLILECLIRANKTDLHSETENIESQPNTTKYSKKVYVEVKIVGLKSEYNQRRRFR